MADQILLQPAEDANGNRIASAVASFFQSGTTTPVTMYQVDGTTPLGTSVVAGLDGVFPQVFTTSGTAIKIEVKTPLGAMIPGYPVDPAIRTPAINSAASAVSFAPTVNVPQTNVQDAIEGLYLEGNTLNGRLYYRRIVRSSLSGTQVFFAIPSDVIRVELEYWNFLPSVAGTNLSLQVGTGTVGSPTWVSSYNRVATLNSNGTISGTVSSAIASLPISPAQLASGGPSNGLFRITPFNTNSTLTARGTRAGVVSGPVYSTSDEYGVTTAAATHTLLRLFVSAGTMSGEYSVWGFSQ